MFPKLIQIYDIYIIIKFKNYFTDRVYLISIECFQIPCRLSTGLDLLRQYLHGCLILMQLNRYQQVLRRCLELTLLSW